MNSLLSISSVVILLLILFCTTFSYKEGLHDGSGKKHGGFDTEKTCKACMEGYKLSDDRHSCGIIPIPNCYKRDGILCEYCDKGFKLTKAKNACIPAEFLNCKTQEGLVCKECLPGYKLSYNKKLCLAIPIPRCEKQADTTCTKCIKPYTVDEEGTCKDCEKGYGNRDGWCRPATTDIANCKHQRKDKCLVCNQGYTVKDGLCSKLVLPKKLKEEAKIDEYVTIEKTCDAVVCPDGFSIKPKNTVCSTERVLKSELNLFGGEKLDLESRIADAKKRDEEREKDIEERKARAERDSERRRKALEEKVAREAKALGEGSLGKLLKDANRNFKSEIIVEGEIRPSKGSLIKTLVIDPDYRLEFTIIPLSKGMGWRNIIHSTIRGQNMCDDCRVPGIWFHSNTTRLHIRSGSIGNGNFGYDPKMELPLNQETNVTITVQGDEMKVEYSGAITHSKTVKTFGGRKGGAAKFYASNPWDEPAGCKIKNVKWTNFGGHESAALAFNELEKFAKDDFNADCQSLSDKYGTNYGYFWGTAGPAQRAWWKKHKCSTRPVLGGEQDKMQGKSFGNLCQGMSDKYKTSYGVSWGTAGLKERGWWANHQCKTRPAAAKDGMVMKYIYKGYFGPCGGKIPDHHGNEQWGDDFNFFKTASLVSTEKTATINLVPNSLKPKHSVMITGTMIPKENGTLTFLLESDDASYLIIEGKVVVDNGGLHPKRARTGTLDGEKFRRYPFTIFMGECGGANNLALTVTGAGGVYYDSKGGSGANVPQNPKFDAEKRKEYDAQTAPGGLGQKKEDGDCRAKDGVLGPNGSGGAHTWSKDENGVPVIYETCYDTKTRKGNTIPRKNIYKCNYGSEQPVCTATWLASKYERLPKNTNCPAGSDITTQAECQTAIRALALKYDPWWTGNHGEIPRGCTWTDAVLDNKSRGSLSHWNAWTNSAGKPRYDLHPICKKGGETGTGIIRLEEKGETQCPGGMRELTKSECVKNFPNVDYDVGNGPNSKTGGHADYWMNGCFSAKGDKDSPFWNEGNINNKGNSYGIGGWRYCKKDNVTEPFVGGMGDRCAAAQNFTNFRNGSFL